MMMLFLLAQLENFIGKMRAFSQIFNVYPIFAFQREILISRLKQFHIHKVVLPIRNLFLSQLSIHLNQFAVS